MKIVHPVADEWTETYTVYCATALSVLLTEPVAAFLDYAKTERLRPVLLTSAEARLSSFVSFALGESGGFWAVQNSDGAIFDGRSARQIFAFTELWLPDPELSEHLQITTAPEQHDDHVLMFDFHTHHRGENRAATSPAAADLAQFIVRALDGAPLDVSGEFEPLTNGWQPEQITEQFHRQLPVSQVVYARGPDDSFCSITASQTTHGLTEYARGGVPAGPSASTGQKALALVGAALSQIAKKFEPTIGLISFVRTGSGVTQRAGAQDMKVPLAALLSPRAVHELKANIDELAARHHVTTVGNQRDPHHLISFTEPAPELWADFVAFGYDMECQGSRAH